MKHFSFILLISSLLLLFSACKKDESIIGLELQDGNALLGTQFSDTTTISAYSVREDSIITTRLANNVLGFVNDPIFGRTQAGIYTQFDLSGSGITFPNNAQLDSVVLTLQYAGFFGDTTSPTTIKVYELSERLDRNTVYYSHSSLQTKGENLTYSSDYQLFLKPTSQTMEDTNVKNPHIRIRLSDQFGTERLLHNPSLSDNAAFQNDFKGLYIVSEGANGTGNLAYVNLIGALSGITIYYHDDLATGKKYTFSISSTNCTFFNFYDHFSYNSAAQSLRNQIVNLDYTHCKDELYLQGTSGVKVHLDFPYLKQAFKDKKVVFNKAELVISNLSDDVATHFFPPSDLGLQLVRSDHSIGYLPDDEIYTSTNYFGGTYDTEKKEYRFRITKYVQQAILSQTTDNGINIVVSGAGNRANRLVLVGTNPNDLLLTEKRLRLELSYTNY